MSWIRSIVVAAAALALGGLFASPALAAEAAEKTCEIGKRARSISIKPGETVVCKGESGPAGNVTVDCRFDQEATTSDMSKIQFDSRNYKTVEGPKGGDVLEFNSLKSVYFRGDTEDGRDYQFIFKNISERGTPSVSVRCEP